MSKSNIEKSQPDTDPSCASEETLDSFPPTEPTAGNSTHSAALSAVYAGTMALICALLMRRHSRHWKRWAAAVGVCFFALGRYAVKGASRND